MARIPAFSSLLLLVWVLFTFSAVHSQATCSGRCGEPYYRGYDCQCDYECFIHGECCPDYRAQCTREGSCKGRCGETFKRGRQCDCDPDCTKFNKCCPDHQHFCSSEDFSESELLPLSTALPYNQEFTTPQSKGLQGDDVSPVPEGTSGSEPPPSSALDAQNNIIDILATPQPDRSITEESEGDPGPNTEESPAPVSEELTTQAEVSTPVPGSTTSPDTSPFPGADTTSFIPECSTSYPSTSTTPQPSTLGHSTTPLDALPDTITSAPQSAVSLPASASNPNPLQPNEDNQTPSENLDVKPDTKPIPETNEATEDLQSVTPKPPDSKPIPETNEATEDLQSVTPKPPDSKPIPETNEATEDPQSVTPKPDKESPQGQIDTKGDSDDAPTKDKPDQDQVAKPAAGGSETPTTPLQKPLKPSKETDGMKTENSVDYQADDSNDTNLCSGRPINGLTTLSNGTTVVFRGHYFWTLDSDRNPGPARGITDVWGIPSPIDTVYTRCNCQGKTFFFKGSNYWRFENGVMDLGYPKSIRMGFNGLSGQVLAALSVPAYHKRKESVFFFKRGGLVQRYTYQVKPSCGMPVMVATTPNRMRLSRQAESSLGPAVNIRVSWRGFPSPVTSAVSVPDTKPGGEGYTYYVFSRSKYHKVKMVADKPVVSTPESGTAQPKSAKSWFKCPETQLV